MPACFCKICSHEKRREIEQAVLARDFTSDSPETLEQIANEFKVPLRDLQIHTLMHIPLDPFTPSEDESAASNGDAANTQEKRNGYLTEQIKVKEADYLRKLLEDQYATFRNLTSKVNQIVSNHRTDAPTLSQLTQQTVSLYLGASGAIRETVNTIIKLNTAVNGEHDEGLSALANLVKVLNPKADSSAPKTFYTTPNGNEGEGNGD